MIKSRLLKHKRTKAIYVELRDIYHRTIKISYFFYDIKRVLKSMFWRGVNEHRYWAASAELLFQYHKLEKGLCMPGEPRFFGYDPSMATLDLLQAWRKSKFPTTDRVYIGALATLKAYSDKIEQIAPTQTQKLRQLIAQELDQSETQIDLITPIDSTNSLDESAERILTSILIARRSQRDFSDSPVPVQVIEKAVSMAQQSPSACNRQPWRVHSYMQKQNIEALLQLQNGNRGFGHTIPNLLIITAESSGFFDASERHQPYIDGGLFSMSLILAFQSLGLSTCCLNWCVSPKNDRLAHQIGAIPESEIIIMYLAVGYAQVNSKVPASPRRDLDSVIKYH